jgi:hypothetical protein
VARRVEEALKLLALKGVIVGFGRRGIYVKSEEHRKLALAALRSLGLADAFKEEDIIVIGEVKALSAQPSPRTQKFRPLVMGVSLGQRDITAGTLGGFAEKDGEAYIVSCAHVLHPWPLSPKPPHNKAVWQPGPYDTGYDYSHEDQYAVADYAGHVRLRSMYDYSECPATRLVNAAYRLLGRRSRAILLQVPNYVDLGVARLREGVGYEDNTYAYKYEGRQDFDVRKLAYVGNLFAGSTYGHAVISKNAKYWRQYFPQLSPAFPHLAEDAEIGAQLCKDGRTSGATCGAVIDNAFSVVVSYGLDVCWFEDTILTSQDMKASGGDSGSPAFTKI